MSEFLRKLSSRKLWAAIVGVVVGLAAAFGINEGEWAQVAGIVTSAVSVVAYICGEAKIDAASANPSNYVEFVDERQEDENADK